MKHLTASQKKKADRIAKLINELKDDGVYSMAVSSRLAFYRKQLEFGEFPEQEFLYRPEQTVIIEDLNS